MENSIDRYQEWSHDNLNQRIFALYEQIEKVTLENLQVAQKNCQLQVQIRTIDDILEESQVRSSRRSASTNRSEVSYETKYQNLLQDHMKLAQRVNQIEYMLYESNRKRGQIARSLRNSASKTPSYMPTHRKTNTRVDYGPERSENTSRHQTLRRKSSRFK